MNGRKAKEIRKKIYGDEPCNRGKRKYHHIKDGNGETVVCTGKRREYQDAKREQK